MRQAIAGYGRDEAGDWVAHLTCGHRQHVRHDPPFARREWVLSAAGRAAMLGTAVECPPCERGDPPADDAEQGGEAACYAYLLCEDCGVVLEPGAAHRPGCARTR